MPTVACFPQVQFTPILKWHLFTASTMMLYISDHGRQGRSALAAAPLILDSAW